ncbi:hypothetical protein B0H34DRAFT_678039 [Crassisporium funariophilum]|nr:hypothetical protein B0H34DRAFT_678039 [Crassisporium funariophilum]
MDNVNLKVINLTNHVRSIPEVTRAVAGGNHPPPPLALGANRAHHDNQQSSDTLNTKEHFEHERTTQTDRIGPSTTNTNHDVEHDDTTFLTTPSTQCTTSAVFTFRTRDAVIWFDDAAVCRRRCHPGCFLVISGDGDVVSTGTGRVESEGGSETRSDGGQSGRGAIPTHIQHYSLLPPFAYTTITTLQRLQSRQPLRIEHHKYNDYKQDDTCKRETKRGPCRRRYLEEGSTTLPLLMQLQPGAFSICKGGGWWFGKPSRHLLHLGNRLHVTANQYVEHHRDIIASPPLSGRHLRVRVRREKWDVRWGDRLSLPEVGSGRVVGCWCWDEASPLGREKVRRNGSITMSQPGDGSLNRAPRSPVLPRNPNSSTRAVLAQSRRRCTTLRMVKAIVSVQGDLMLGGHSYTAGLAPATGGAIHIRSEERGNYDSSGVWCAVKWSRSTLTTMRGITCNCKDHDSEGQGECGENIWDEMRRE